MRRRNGSTTEYSLLLGALTLASLVGIGGIGNGVDSLGSSLVGSLGGPSPVVSTSDSASAVAAGSEEGSQDLGIDQPVQVPSTGAATWVAVRERIRNSATVCPSESMWVDYASLRLAKVEAQTANFAAGAEELWERYQRMDANFARDIQELADRVAEVSQQWEDRIEAAGPQRAVLEAVYQDYQATKANQAADLERRRADYRESIRERAADLARRWQRYQEDRSQEALDFEAAVVASRAKYLERRGLS